MNNTNTQTEQQIDTSEMDGKYLTFWTDKQLFGIPISHVVQIVGMQNITEVPEFPYYAKGIINLRGSIIPLIDARLRLGKAEAEYNERTCVIVTSINEHFVGFIVDEVDAVVTISDDLIVPPPRLDANNDSYITGVGKLGDKVVLLMDTRKIVGVEDLEILTAPEAAM
ncbi:MAG: chemotaxis protein CheW [Oscillospiraceae bacterium]